jgi:hypothetical protein
MERQKGTGTMGICSPSEIIYPKPAKEMRKHFQMLSIVGDQINISLNRLYLLNKLGHDKYFTSNPAYGNYYYLDISFSKMIEKL